MKKWIIILLFCSAAPAGIFINSFNSGRLSPDLKVRADLERHTMGSETLTNILIKPQGMAYKRPGTEYIETRIADMNIPGVAEVPGFAYRDEALVIAANTYVYFLDPNYTIVTSSNIGGGSCMTVDIDDSGNVVAGKNGNNANMNIWSWDADMNLTTDFYQPAAGFWGNTGVGAMYFASLCFSDDGNYLYAVVNEAGGVPVDIIYKFDTSTGQQVWQGKMYWGLWSSYVDSQGNIYVPYSGYQVVGETTYWDPGIFKWDSDGNLDTIYTPYASGTRDCWVDETMSRLFWSGDNTCSITLDNDSNNYWVWNNASTMWSIKVISGRLYCCGGRQDPGSGFANIWELNPSDGTILNFYDTGDSELEYLWEDKDGNIISKQADGGTTTFYVFDAELTLLDSSSISGTDGLYGAEGVAIPYWTDAVPGTPDQYWSFNHGAGDPVRLIPFEYSVSDAYVIEMGHRYLSFLRTVP